MEDWHEPTKKDIFEANLFAVWVVSVWGFLMPILGVICAIKYLFTG